MTCTGIRLRWDVSAEFIRTETRRVIDDSRAVHDAVGGLDPRDVCYENVVKALADDDANYRTRRSQLDFLQRVTPDKALHDASVEADKKLSEFDVEISMREDVMRSLLAVREKLKGTLETEAERYVDRLIKLRQRNGLHLEKDIQKDIREIKKRITSHCIDFKKNLNEENTVLEFTEQELDGLPADFLCALDKSESGKLKVTLKYPHYLPCMNFAHNPETRKMLDKAFYSRCVEENVTILEELISLRQKTAELLNYSNHVVYMLEMQMAKSAAKVAEFLADLQEPLQPLKSRELKSFLEHKKASSERYGFEFDDQINMWDIRYCMTRVEEYEYTVNHAALREYFPLDTVTTGLLGIYADLLSLHFELIPDAEVWHEDVRLYKVVDEKSRQLMGYFYLDLFPRELKFGHAGCFQLQLKTYFHEFGHAMHHICAQAKFAMFSGFSVERDFLEAPSQMLENWCWEEESLRRMSGHYKDGSAIPDDLLKPLLASRKANAGFRTFQRILLAYFDQHIHSGDQCNVAEKYSELSQQILGTSAIPESNMAASFLHLVEGYDAQFYSYLWSEVISADMFYSRFKTEGIMSPAVGLDYRQFILQPGGSMDGEVMLRNFLGRDPKPDAFLMSKGIKM